jgi:hypothetical protein
MIYNDEVIKATMEYFDSNVSYPDANKLDDFRWFIEDKMESIDKVRNLKSICLGIATSEHDRSMKIIFEEAPIVIDKLKYERDQAKVFKEVAMQYHSLL